MSTLKVNAIQSNTTQSINVNSNLGNISNIEVAGVGTFSGGIVVAAGSTSAPSISPIGDSNTGIFFPSPDTIAFAEGGTEALRINSSNNIGIGTANPNAKLHVQDGYLKIEQNVNGENTLYLRNTNTTGSGAYSVIRFSESNDVGNAGNAYIHYFNSGYASNGFWDSRSLAAGTSNGNINFNVGGANEFKVWTNSSQKFVITSAGNIGIGSTTPTEKLTVNGKIESLSDGVGEGGQLILRATPRSGSGSQQYRWALDNNDNGTRGNDRLRFIRENDSDASSGVEYMSINTDGNLQFRTAAPKILNTSGNTILAQSGSIIQTVIATQTSGAAITASTETTIYNPLISITPRNSNSLIFFDIQFFGYHNSANDFYTSLYVRRNSLGTAISSNQGGQWGDWTRNFGSMVAAAAHADYHFTCWDYPGTTSAVTYLLTGKNHQASRNFQIWAGDGSTAKQMLIIALEIAQ